MSSQARCEAVVHGLVQGVNFRYFTRREASQLGLVGWVRNRWDGTVEVVAEGERSQLEKFLAWLHHGPSAAVVERVEVNWIEATGEFTHFEIRY